MRTADVGMCVFYRGARSAARGERRRRAAPLASARSITVRNPRSAANGDQRPYSVTSVHRAPRTAVVYRWGRLKPHHPIQSCAYHAAGEVPERHKHGLGRWQRHAGCQPDAKENCKYLRKYPPQHDSSSFPAGSTEASSIQHTASLQHSQGVLSSAWLLKNV